MNEHSVEFDDRNIRQSPDARAELLALTGDLVVPTLVAGDRQVVGFDAAALAEIAGRQAPEIRAPSAAVAAGPPGNSLEADQGQRVIASGDTLADDLRNLLGRINAELDYNVAKGATPFRQGMHDGLRFAQDAVADLLSRHGHTAEVAPRDWDF
ncbi:MAG: glutaredoxin family protein [Acidimicrobiia bacterium]|nr:glutaredoxin family protein [Acidimicrobiia bacterium]